AASANYSAPSFDGTNSPVLTIGQAALSASLTVPGQVKTYGQDDPLVGGIGRSEERRVGKEWGSGWTGKKSINDSALSSSETSLSRPTGDDCGWRSVVCSSDRAASANYSAPSFDGTNSPVLTIGQAALSASLTVPGQVKTYGQDDPLVGGIG